MAKDNCTKGTGSGGHHYWLPDCKSFTGTSAFRYDDFDTAPESEAGNAIDNKAREESMVRSIYNKETPYSAQTVNQNYSREGQYSMS